MYFYNRDKRTQYEPISGETYIPFGFLWYWEELLLYFVSMTKRATSHNTPFINVKRISIRFFSTLIFLVSVIVAIIIFLVVSDHSRQKVAELQKNSLSRVISVAVDGVLVDLRDNLVNIGNALQRRSEIRLTLKEFQKTGDASDLIIQLDDPLINGFVGTADIELVKLRVYDNEYNFIAESSRGIKGLTRRLPEFMSSRAKTRTGASSLKALGGLWTDDKSEKTLYSLLIPIGGLKILGYLEVIIDPLFNLIDVAKVTQKPLTIYNAKGKELKHLSPIKDLSCLSLEKIEYTLIGSDNKNAFHMVLLDDVSDFNKNMEMTRIIAVSGFIAVSSLVILISLSLMSRYLFKPIRHMIEQMRLVADGDLSIEVDNYGLKDFHELALSFNTMREMVHANMQNLERMSFLDGLTGIGNRRLFDQTLEKEWQHHKRTGNPLSLIICDIDLFKPFNDTYGHLAGDECIQQISQAIKKAIYRPTDLACRYGGEEFALILPETPLEGARHIAELIRQQVIELGVVHESSPASGSVTLSLGVATAYLEAGVESPEELINAADIALYLAKESGRNQVKTAEG